jgi:hypothetical protein
MSTAENPDLGERQDINIPPCRRISVVLNSENKFNYLDVRTAIERAEGVAEGIQETMGVDSPWSFRVPDWTTAGFRNEERVLQVGENLTSRLEDLDPVLKGAFGLYAEVFAEPPFNEIGLDAVEAYKRFLGELTAPGLSMVAFAITERESSERVLGFAWASLATAEDYIGWLIKVQTKYLGHEAAVDDTQGKVNEILKKLGSDTGIDPGTMIMGASEIALHESIRGRMGGIGGSAALLLLAGMERYSKGIAEGFVLLTHPESRSVRIFQGFGAKELGRVGGAGNSQMVMGGSDEKIRRFIDKMLG